MLCSGDLQSNNNKFKEVALDVYKHNLNGLFTVEVEFESETDCDTYIPEPWFGLEVTENKKYSNFNLCLYGKPE
jgi:CYTH domain-containing protein